MPRPNLIASLDALRFEHKRHQLAVIAAILVTPTIVFTAVDLAVSGNDLPRLAVLLAVRIAVVAVAFLGIFGVARLTSEQRFDRAVQMLSYVIVLLTLTVHLLRPASFTSPYFVEVLVIMALYAILPARWTRQLGPALLITGVGILLLVVWHTGVDLILRVSIAVALILANAIGIAVGWHHQRLEERINALGAAERESSLALATTTAELRTLQRILPICSYCRNVRDTEGAWAELEAYVHSHLDTRFSHGICPGCLSQHYPDEQPLKPR